MEASLWSFFAVPVPTHRQTQSSAQWQIRLRSGAGTGGWRLAGILAQPNHVLGRSRDSRPLLFMHPKAEVLVGWETSTPPVARARATAAARTVTTISCILSLSGEGNWEDSLRKVGEGDSIHFMVTKEEAGSVCVCGGGWRRTAAGFDAVGCLDTAHVHDFGVRVPGQGCCTHAVSNQTPSETPRGRGLVVPVHIHSGATKRLGATVLLDAWVAPTAKGAEVAERRVAIVMRVCKGKHVRSSLWVGKRCKSAPSLLLSLGAGKRRRKQGRKRSLHHSGYWDPPLQSPIIGDHWLHQRRPINQIRSTGINVRTARHGTPGQEATYLSEVYTPMGWP